MSQQSNRGRKGSHIDKNVDKVTTRSKTPENDMCRDCSEPVLKGDQALICDLCSYWLHAKCQNVSDVAYQFLASNENIAINWYCSHCKPAALGVVAEVQKIAQKYADIDKRVKKLETQVKHKANTADLEDLRKTVLEDLDDKVTVDEMKDMQAMINESTKKVITESHSAMAKKHETDIKSAITELEKKIPSEDRIKQMILEETPATTQAPTPTSANTREMVDINNRRNNAIINKLPEHNESAYKSQGEQRNQKDMAEASKIAATVLEKPPSDCITKYTRLGKPTTDKVRPLLITFRDTNLKDSFISSLKNLRGTSYHDISIAHDLTKNQRDELQKLKTEASFETSPWTMWSHNAAGTS